MSKSIPSAEEALQLREQTRERKARELQSAMEPDIGYIMDQINHAMLNADTDERGYWHIQIYKRDIKFPDWHTVIREAIIRMRTKGYYIDEPKPRSAIFTKNSSYIISFKPGPVKGTTE